MGKHVELEPKEIRSLGTFGAMVLKRFHEAYALNSISLETERTRGVVTGWRWTLAEIYGDRTTERIVEAASKESGYTIPPAGMLSDDTTAYLGMDSGAHTYIGKLAD